MVYCSPKSLGVYPCRWHVRLQMIKYLGCSLFLKNESNLGLKTSNTIKKDVGFSYGMGHGKWLRRLDNQ